GAKAVLINITGGRDLTMFDVDKVATQIDDEADSNAIIILGASIKEEMQAEISVTVIAAGFDKASSVDILNTPVVPNNVQEAQSEESETVKEDVYKGASRIDIPTFLQR
ncbi:MAG: cell division protein FtsZ, partial [Firmicutes bacterium]|nr:cell division protein FtsZ [Bacillota bacterium]